MLPLGTHVGPYEIVAHLGSGGMGEVYRARDVTLGRTVAVKILPELSASPHATERFEQEAKAASSLAHPNVCHIYMLGSTSEGRQFIAMEYVPGETLRTRLDRERVGLKEALDIAIQIGSALVASHAAGVVHRDIKPENVMVTAEGLVKVLDFGLAKFRTPFSSDIQSTRTMAQTDAGTVLGTVAYMSPEQARGQAVDARTDIWSLAVVLFEMVAGRAPFVGPSGSDVVAAILDREPTPLVPFDGPNSGELHRIINKALRKNRDERYQTAKDLLLDLKALRASLDAPSASTGSPTRAEKPSSVGNRILIGLVGLVLVAGAAAWVYSKRLPETSPAEAPTKIRQITRDAGLTFTPAITRDGRLLAYASDRSGDQLDLWVQQVVGGDPIQITRDEANDYQPTFSPDGATLAFRSDREGGGIYLVSALGGPETFLAPKGLDPRFSPDGNTIAYWVGMEGSGDPESPEWGQLFMIDRNGGKPRRVAGQHRGRHPVWAPDSRHVLFLSSLETRFDWCLVSVADDTVRCLDAEKVVGEHQHLAPSDWVDDKLLYQADAGESADVWQVRIKPDYSGLIGPPERVTFGSGEEVSPTFGTRRQILFADVRRTPDLWAATLDPMNGRSSSTAAERQLTRDLATERNVSATRDGSKLLYSSNRTGTSDLWLRDLATGSETRLTTGEQTGWGLIHQSGSRVAYERVLPDKRILRVLDLTTRQSDEVCSSEWCGSPMGWTSDGKWLLTQLGTSIRAVNVSTKRSVDILKRPPYRLWQPHLSPDDQWIAFVVKPAGNDGRINVVRFRGEQPVESSEWQTVANTGTEDKPRWSDDGRIIYFTSERDGFRCVWGQRFEPSAGKIVGDAFAAYHSHRPRLAMKELPMAPFDIWVANGQLFFNQLERTGNVWLLEPKGN